MDREGGFFLIRCEIRKFSDYKADLGSPLSQSRYLLGPAIGHLMLQLIDLWSRKQSVGLAHQPIGDEAGPLLRGPVELAQS